MQPFRQAKFEITSGFSDSLFILNTITYMKLKNKLFFALILIIQTAFAQQPVQVKGQLNFKRNLVKLFKVAEGKNVQIADAVPTTDGKFGFLFYPEYEGLYVIGTGNEQSQTENYLFYFKKGDQLDISLNNQGYALNGNLNAKENIILQQWYNLIEPIYQKSINFGTSNSTFMDYFPLQEEIVAKSKTFMNGKTSGNPKFDREMKNIMEMDLISYATNFINTPRTAHPSVEEFSDFYGTIKAQNISQNTSKIYNYPWGQRVLSSLIMINMRQDNKAFKAGEEGLNTRLSYVINDTLKGNLVLDNLSGIKNYSDYKTMADKFEKYILTKSQKERSSNIMLPLLTYKSGTDGLQFTYPDKEGKQISFASLNGKVVLVDVWATWCGPCRSEFPHLKQLEKDVEGLPIQIVSISTDAEKDKGKWLKMIKDENLGGMQLYAGESNEFSKYYKVNAIPRFLVFDKKGKIVNVDAPRPSNPKLKELLLAEAAK